jgi:hypothetical protein
VVNAPICIACLTDKSIRRYFANRTRMVEQGAAVLQKYLEKITIKSTPDHCSYNSQ